MPRLIINDDNWREAIKSPCSTGLKPYRTYAGGPVEGVYEDAEVPNIPMEEWPDRIADLERRKATLYHVWRESPIGVLYQNGIPYCHAFSPAFALMLLREVQGLPYVELSAGSIGGPATGYRSRGAWIMQDLKVIIERGCASTEFVPMMQVSRSGWKAGADENCALHKCEEWDKLKSRNLQQHGSSILSGFPVCVGLNYWSHAVTDVRVIDANRRLDATNPERYNIGFVNSHGANFGDKGYAERAGRKKFADEAYVPRQITPSEK